MTSENKPKFVVQVDEDLEDLVDEFLENRRKELSDIEAAVNENDFAAIRKIAHDLIGAGKTYGFDFITDFGRAVDETARSENKELTLNHIKDVKSKFENLEIEFVDEDE